MINHELLIENSRAIRNIANVLPRTKLLYELYPTKEMQQSIANVYAKIIEFVLETMKWYKKGKLQHAISAVINPYKISLKSIVDEIAERSSGVDELASTAFKAELREVHLKIGSLFYG
jgi:DNA-binding ferritin-like protein